MRRAAALARCDQEQRREACGAAGTRGKPPAIVDRDGVMGRTPLTARAGAGAKNRVRLDPQSGEGLRRSGEERRHQDACGGKSRVGRDIQLQPLTPTVRRATLRQVSRQGGPMRATRVVLGTVVVAGAILGLMPPTAAEAAAPSWTYSY